MPELPWDKWFPQDWLGDPNLSMCAPATRGIWADAISAMILRGTDRIEGTSRDFARVCRCSPEDVDAAHADLEHHKAANVSEQEGCKTWINRRRERMLRIKELRRQAGKARWSKDGATPHANAYAKDHAKCSGEQTVDSTSSLSVLEDSDRDRGQGEGFDFEKTIPTGAKHADLYRETMTALAGKLTTNYEQWFGNFHSKGLTPTKETVAAVNVSMSNRPGPDWRTYGNRILEFAIMYLCKTHGRRGDGSGDGMTTAERLAAINERKAREKAGVK